MKRFLLVLLGAGLWAVTPAFAGPITWTDWTSATAGAPGSATGAMGGVTVSYVGEVRGDETQTSGSGTNWWSEGTPAPYTGNSVIDNAPPVGEMIQVAGSGIKNTLSFSTALVDPVMAFVSIGQPNYGVQYAFDAPFTLLSEGSGWWGNGSWTQSENTLTGYEAHGAIQFNGTFSSISWTNDPDEYWHGFTLGMPTQPTGGTDPVPEPGTMVLLGSGLMGLAGYGRKRKKS